MKILNYFVSAVFVSCLCSCTAENEINTSKSIEVTASFPTTSRTTHTSENGVTQVSWVKGDVVGICTKEPLNLKYLALNSVSHTPLVSQGTSDVQINEGDSIIAYYPYVEDMYYANVYNFLNKGGVPFKGISTQNQKDGLSSYDCLYAKGVVKNGKVNLQFHHLFPILKIIFPTKMVSNLYGNQLSLVSTEVVARGDWFYYPDTQSTEHTFDTSLTYNLDPESLKGESVTCYIVMFPQSESAEIAIKDNPAWPEMPSTLQIIKTPKGGFKAGHLYKLDLTSDKYFNSDGGIDVMPEIKW